MYAIPSVRLYVFFVLLISVWLGISHVDKRGGGLIEVSVSAHGTEAVESEILLKVDGQQNQTKRTLGTTKTAGETTHHKLEMQGSSFSNRIGGGGYGLLSGLLPDRNHFALYNTDRTSTMDIKDDYHTVYRIDESPSTIFPGDDVVHDHRSNGLFGNSLSLFGRPSIPFPPTLDYNIPSPFTRRPMQYSSTVRHSEICCADCPSRSIECLANCIRTGCRRREKCANSGRGAYASFCQHTCEVLMGMSMEAEFLPNQACRGMCAGHVQVLCEENACREYGCHAPNCAELAPRKCG